MKIWFRFDLRNEYTDYQKKVFFFHLKRFTAKIFLFLRFSFYFNVTNLYKVISVL